MSGFPIPLSIQASHDPFSAKSRHVNRLQACLPCVLSRPAQTCPNLSFYFAGVPPWVRDSPSGLPPLDLRYLGWCYQNSCGGVLQTLKNTVSGLDQMQSWQSCNLSFFYFEKVAVESTGNTGSQIHSHQSSLVFVSEVLTFVTQEKRNFSQEIGDLCPFGGQTQSW